MSEADQLTVACASRERPPYTFVARTRVAFSDTDAQGIVYYGRYAPYFDLARIEYLRHLGLLGMRSDADGTRIEFVMRHFSIDYHAPATFDDALGVYMRVEAIGTTSMTIRFEVVDHSGQVLAQARQVMVCVRPDVRRPHPIPPALREPIEAFEQAPA